MTIKELFGIETDEAEAEADTESAAEIIEPGPSIESANQDNDTISRLNDEILKEKEKNLKLLKQIEQGNEKEVIDMEQKKIIPNRKGKKTTIFLDGKPTVFIDGEIIEEEESSSYIPIKNKGQYEGVTNITQISELGESLQHLNSDDLEEDTGMTRIDLRSRLSPTEIMYVLAFDSLIWLHVLPRTCLPVTRSKKRLVVSTEGKGRTEVVELVAGKREYDKAKSGFGQGISNFFGGGGGDKTQ